MLGDTHCFGDFPPSVPGFACLLDEGGAPGGHGFVAFVECVEGVEGVVFHLPECNRLFVIRVASKTRTCNNSYMNKEQVTKGQRFNLIVGVGGTYVITKVTSATVYYARINEDGTAGGYFKCPRRTFGNPAMIQFI